MRAIVFNEFGGPNVLLPRDVDTPEPSEGWTVVQLRASALNWHDVLVRQGVYGSPLPHTPGADGAGVRVDSGEDVIILPSLFWGERDSAPSADFQILGDHIPGTYAEFVRVPIECVVPKPVGMSWEQAAALPLVGITTYRALVTRARLSAGESLLIIGATGGISTMAAAIASACGSYAFVTASTEIKLSMAKEAGVRGGVLHTDPAWPAKAKSLANNGEGFDVILDSVGALDASIQALRPGGRLVSMGASSQLTATIDIRPYYFGQYSLLGTTMGSPEDLAGLLALVNAGKLAAPPIAARFSLDEAADAHRFLESGRGFGKIVLVQ